MILKIEIHLGETVMEWDVDYPTQNQISFPIDPNGDTLKINKIMLNGIETNKFYNTSFHIDDSDAVLTSVHEIKLKGVFKLQIDDLYILSHRSNNWHCSTKKTDHIFQYEFTNNSFIDEYRDRDHKGFNTEFTPCFGCSCTFGEAQPATDTWPHILSKKTGRKYLNLGVSGIGIDGIYINLKLLHQKHNFNECLMVFPTFERRLVRCKIGKYYVSIPSNVNLSQDTGNFHFYKNKNLQDQMHKVNSAIRADTENRYSKRFLQKIIRYCESNGIKLYASSWADDVYDFLKTNKQVNLLGKFPSLSLFSERANDGGHPHKKHYEYFAEQITRFL